MKNVARLSFILNTALFGSFYAITKEALVRIDPVIFTFFEDLILVPIALILVAMNWRDLDKHILKRGITLGSWLCLAMLTMTVSLRFTGATNTAFFPALGGIVGALITGIVLKRPLTKKVWIAGGLSLTGVIIMLTVSGGGLEFRGDLIALLGALFFTAYIFLVDHDIQSNDQRREKNAIWLILGIEYLTLALWMTLIALLFGNWQQFHPVFPKDIEIFIYIGLGTTFVPFVISTFMQNYIEPLEVAFISVLEPIWGSLIAYVYLGERASLPIYIAGVFVITGAILHTWSASRYFMLIGTRLSFPTINQYARGSKVTAIGYPMLLLGAGAFLLNWLGGSFRAVWSDFYYLGSEMHAPISQGQEASIVLLWIHAILWLVAWSALIVIGVLTAISVARNFLISSEKRLPASSPFEVEAHSKNGSPIIVTRSRTTRKFDSLVARRRLAARERRLGMYTEENGLYGHTFRQRQRGLDETR